MTGADAQRSGDKTNSPSSFDNNRNTTNTKHQYNGIKPKLQETQMRSYMHGAKTSKEKPGDKMSPACAAANVPQKDSCEPNVNDCEKTYKKKKTKYYMDTPTARKFNPMEPELVLPPPEIEETPKFKLPKGFPCCAKPRHKRRWRRCSRPPNARAKPLCMEPKPLEHHCKICTPKPCFSPAAGVSEKVETIKDKILSNQDCAWKERHNWNKSCRNEDETCEEDFCGKMLEMREKCERKQNCSEEKKEEDKVCEDQCEEVEKECRKEETDETCHKDLCKKDVKELECLNKDLTGLEKEAPCRVLIEEVNQSFEIENDKSLKQECKEENLESFDKACNLENTEVLSKDASCKEMNVEIDHIKESDNVKKIDDKPKKKMITETLMEDCMKKWGIEDPKELLSLCKDENEEKCEETKDKLELGEKSAEIKVLVKKMEKVVDARGKPICMSEGLNEDPCEQQVQVADPPSKCIHFNDVDEINKALAQARGDAPPDPPPAPKVVKQVECETPVECKKQEDLSQKCNTYAGVEPPPKCEPPVASTPVASTPVASTPVSSTPVASTPVASTPVASTPVASTPVASTSIASTPVASTPVASTSIASTPVASTPVASTPVASTPVASTPVASLSTASTPVASTPVASTPAASTSIASAPVASTPEPVAITPLVVTSAPVTVCKSNETCQQVTQCDAKKSEEKTEVDKKILKLCPEKQKARKMQILVANKNRFCKSFSAAGRKKIMKLKRERRLAPEPVPDFEEEENPDCVEEENPDCKKLKFQCPSFEPLNCKAKSADKKKKKKVKEKKKKTKIVMECEDVEVARVREAKEALKLSILLANKRRFFSGGKAETSGSNCGVEKSPCRKRSR